MTRTRLLVLSALTLSLGIPSLDALAQSETDSKRLKPNVYRSTARSTSRQKGSLQRVITVRPRKSLLTSDSTRSTQQSRTGKGKNATPQTPTAVTAIDAGSRTALASWAASANATGYELERSPAFPGGIVALDGFTLSFTDATGAGTFSYRVRAVGQRGRSDFSAWASVAVADITPARPELLSVQDMGNYEQARVSWRDNSDNEQRFIVTRETKSSGVWAQTGSTTLSAGATSMVDAPGPGEHQYQIVAVGSVGTSDPSAWLGVTIARLAGPGPAMLAQPSGLDAVDTGRGSADVRWLDMSDNEDAFEVERDPAFPEGRRSVARNQAHFLDDSGAGAFAYRVRAVNAVGASAFTEWDTAIVADTLPAAPSNIVAAASDDRFVLIGWQDNSENETAFRIETQRQEGTSWGVTRVVLSSENSWEQSDLPGPGTHRYRVAAMNDSGLSDYSLWTQVTLASTGADPAAPGGVVAQDLGNRKVGLTWLDMSGDEQGFELSREPAFAGGTVSLLANTTGYVDDSGPGTFSYRVRAFNDVGYSDWSNAQSVVVRDTVPQAPSAIRASDSGDQRRVSLAWSDNSFNESGFIIERGSWSGGAWSAPVTFGVSANATSFADDVGVGRFRYRIRSFNDSGDSAWSDYSTVSVTDGWTPIVASADTRTIYVSSSTGNDSNSGLTESTPKRTLRAGFDALRNGYPDHLRLRRGDSWTNEKFGTEYNGWDKAGRSGSEPMVVWYYGADTRRPLIKVADYGKIHLQRDLPIVGVWFVGLHWQAYKRVPGPEYVADPAGKSPPTAFILYNPAQDILIEDCMIEACSTNISLQAPVGSMARNVTLRRSIVADAYSGADGEHSQGLYASRIDGLLIDECVFDHNGWSEVIPNRASNIFNHNMYLQPANNNVIVRNTITARASATGIQMRGNRQDAINNLSLKNPLGITSGHEQSPWPDQAGTGFIRHNVVLDAYDIGGTDGVGLSPRGFGIMWARTRNLTIEKNIVAHNVSSQGSEPALNGRLDSEQITVTDNIVYNWLSTNNGSIAVRLDVTQPASNVWRDNCIQQPRGGWTMITSQAVPGGAFSGNCYYSSTNPSNGWFRAAYTGISHPDWVTRSGETGGQTVQAPFPDPERTIATYMRTLGWSGTDADALKAFLAEARQQARTNWRDEYSAKAVNRYVREGFGMPEPAN